MKKIFVLLFISFLSFQFSSAQIYQGKDAEKYIPGSQMVRFSGENENPLGWAAGKK